MIKRLNNREVDYGESEDVNMLNDFKLFLRKKLPYSLRLHILSFVSVKSSRFYVDHSIRNKNDPETPVKYLYSYETREYVDEAEFHQLVYGYFVQDRERKIYLVFGYLVYRCNMLLEFLPRKNVRQLYFLNKELSFENLKKIPLNIRRLCFSDMKINADEMTLIVKKLRRLRKFAIQNVKGLNNLELMDVLASKCTVVRVMQCDLLNQCVEILVQSPTIKNIDLKINKQVTTMGILKIRERKNIVHFRMNGTSLDDEAIELFLENPQIHELQLTETKVTQKGFLKLLRSPSNIRSLEWKRNEIIQDLEIIDNVEGQDLEKNRILEYLKLDQTKISRGACLVTSSILDNLVVLSMNNCNIEDEHVKCFLENQPKIHKLSLSFNSLLTQETIVGIINHERIGEVEYRQTELGDEDVMLFFQSERIKELWIQGANITDECFKSLENNNTLELIKFVGYNHMITREGVRYLKTLPNIKYIVSSSDTYGVDTVDVWVRD